MASQLAVFSEFSNAQESACALLARTHASVLIVHLSVGADVEIVDWRINSINCSNSSGGTMVQYSEQLFRATVCCASVCLCA